MTTPCPDCGHLAAAEALTCPHCGHALSNGTAQPLPRPKPPPPPEVANWVMEKITPEIEALLGPLDLEAFMADVREIEETGGVPFEEIISEIEEMVKRRE